jgi:glycosyltransferase involved in cell wall biosynthesis
VLAGSGSQGPDAPPGALGLGYVAQEHLPALYGAATVVGYASRYEGFGLPPVEAMACGAVVVASAVGALPEVVTDGAVLVGTHDLDSWSTALGRVVRDADLRAALQVQAVVEAGRLSWAGTAEGTLRAYRQAGLTL